MRLSFFVVVFIAVISVILFSGQVRRPYAPPQQSQQNRELVQEMRERGIIPLTVEGEFKDAIIIFYGGFYRCHFRHFV